MVRGASVSPVVKMFSHQSGWMLVLICDTPLYRNLCGGGCGNQLQHEGSSGVVSCVSLMVLRPSETMACAYIHLKCDRGGAVNS